MNARRLWFAVDLLLVGVIAFYAVPAHGQTLQPVTGSFDWWPLVIFGVAAIAIAGLVVWHKRNPSGQTKALMDAHSAMGNLVNKTSEALNWSQQHVADLIAKVPAKPPEVAHPPLETLDPDKLAAVEAARVAYENAKADAGIP